MEFKDLKKAVQNQFYEMQNGELFTVDATKDELWETYLNSFPEGSNPIYKERTEHDCNCCKSFIRTLGKVVAIVDSKLVSIWDIEIGGQESFDFVEEKTYCAYANLGICE